MTVISTTWTKVKEVYVGNDGYHDVVWRMYARIGAQSGSSTTVQVMGKLYLSGSAGSITCGELTTVGGAVGNYQAWGVGAEGTYYPGETDLWYGTDTTTGSSMVATVKFYSSPWGWTGDNLALTDTLTFQAPTPPTPTPTVLEKCHDYDFYGSASDVSARVLKLYGGNPSPNLLNDPSAREANHGIEVTKNSDGSFTVSGVLSGTWANITGGVAISLKKGNTYSFSINSTPETLPVGITFRTGPTRYDFAVPAGSKSYSGVLGGDEDKNTVYIFLYGTDGTRCDFTLRPQIENGASPTPYQPYLGPQGAFEITKLYGSVYGVTRRIF